MKVSIRALAVSGLSSVLLSACASVASLDPGAKSVTLSDSKPSSKCEVVVKIKAIQKGAMIPANKLEEGAKNQLRNAAYKKQANYVYIKDNYSDSMNNTIESNAIASVTIDGIAYRCPQ